MQFDQMTDEEKEKEFIALLHRHPELIPELRQIAEESEKNVTSAGVGAPGTA